MFLDFYKLFLLMPLSQRRQEARLIILFNKIINGLAQVHNTLEGLILIRTTIISGACKRTYRDTSMHAVKLMNICQ